MEEENKLPVKAKKEVIVTPMYRIIMGTISLLSGITMAILGGFNFYNPDSSAIWALLSIGMILIGLGVSKEFKNRG